jgi:hypothetical protein
MMNRLRILVIGVVLLFVESTIFLSLSWEKSSAIALPRGASKTIPKGTEVTYQVAASADDAVAYYRPQAGDYFASNSGASILFGNDTLVIAYKYRAYQRFSLDIPANSIIHYAYLKVVASADIATIFNATVRLLDNDSVDAFPSSGSLYNWNATYSSVRWYITNPWVTGTEYTSPNLAALVQEFVDRPGYASGNYIGIRLDADGNAAGIEEQPEANGDNDEYREYTSWDGDPTVAAKLVIGYTSPLELPPTPTTDTYSILEGLDDAYAVPNWVENTVEELKLYIDVYVIVGGGYIRTYQRFRLDVPSGAIIVNATLKVVATYGASIEFVPTIKLLDNDSCDNFATNPIDWKTTNSSIGWYTETWAPGQEYQSPNLRVLVQEFVDRPGYVPGNYIGIRVDDGDIDNIEYGQERYYASYENVDFPEPILEIKYIPPEAPPSPPSPVNLGVQGFMASSTGLLHITNHTPLLNWTFTDPNPGDSQQAYNVSVWNGSVETGELLWYKNETSSANNTTYLDGGIIVATNYELVDGYCYNFSVAVNDTQNLWSSPPILMFRMNSKPEARSLKVDNYTEEAIAQILNITTRYPSFSWSFIDLENDLQVQFNVSIWNKTREVLMWYKNATGTNDSVTYNELGGAFDALALEDEKVYWFLLEVSDGWEWSISYEVKFRMNFTITFELVKGWNFVTLPLGNETYQRAGDLANSIDFCLYIASWNNTTQEFDIYTRGSDENNFTLENGTGYFVYVESSSTFDLEGEKIDYVDLRLAKGWNSIGRFNFTILTDEEFLQEVPSSMAIAYWDSVRLRFVLHPKDKAISNFTLEFSGGYLLWVENDILWRNE